jgi:hypothetical protein
MHSTFIVVGLPVDLDNIKPLNVATEKQQWVTYALLSSYKTFSAAVNNKNILRSSCKVSDIFVRL